MSKILISNLPADTEVEVVEQLFSRFGEVTNIRLVRDDISRRARSYGVVEMPRQDEAKRAIRQLDRQVFRGTFLNVRTALQGEAQSQAFAAS
jgi:RNA recognition motif-containing protein